MWLVLGAIILCSLWAILILYLMGRRIPKACIHEVVFLGGILLMGFFYKFLMFLWNLGLSHMDTTNRVLDWLNS